MYRVGSKVTGCDVMGIIWRRGGPGGLTRGSKQGALSVLLYCSAMLRVFPVAGRANAANAIAHAAAGVNLARG